MIRIDNYLNEQYVTYKRMYSTDEISLETLQALVNNLFGDNTVLWEDGILGCSEEHARLVPESELPEELRIKK